MKKFLFLGACLMCVPLLTQCNTLKKDIEAIKLREAEIAKEPHGDYYIGRRYYIPSTRFWGYLRRPGQSWRTAELVIMEESKCRTPDRLPEGGEGKCYSYDKNYEYIVHGKFTGTKAYEPNTNMELPVFQPTKFKQTNTNPGWLFKPSEKYQKKFVSLRPSIMPDLNTPVD